MATVASATSEQRALTETAPGKGQRALAQFCPYPASACNVHSQQTTAYGPRHERVDTSSSAASDFLFIRIPRWLSSGVCQRSGGLHLEAHSNPWIGWCFAEPFRLWPSPSNKARCDVVYPGRLNPGDARASHCPVTIAESSSSLIHEGSRSDHHGQPIKILGFRRPENCYRLYLNRAARIMSFVRKSVAISRLSVSMDVRNASTVQSRPLRWCHTAPRN